MDRGGRGPLLQSVPASYEFLARTFLSFFFFIHVHPSRGAVYGVDGGCGWWVWELGWYWCGLWGGVALIEVGFREGVG